MIGTGLSRELGTGDVARIRTPQNGVPEAGNHETRIEKLPRMVFQLIRGWKTAEDFLNGIIALVEAGTALGVPTKQTINMIGGMGDIIDSSYQVGLARLLGWYEFRREKEFEDKSSRGLVIEIPAIVLELPSIDIPSIE